MKYLTFVILAMFVMASSACGLMDPAINDAASDALGQLLDQGTISTKQYEAAMTALTERVPVDFDWLSVVGTVLQQGFTLALGYFGIRHWRGPADKAGKVAMRARLA